MGNNIETARARREGKGAGFLGQKLRQCGRLALLGKKRRRHHQSGLVKAKQGERSVGGCGRIGGSRSRGLGGGGRDSLGKKHKGWGGYGEGGR